MTRPHYSVTQMTMLARCPAQYNFRYAQGIIAPPGIAMLVGGGAHGGFEYGMRQKAKTGADTKPDDVRDAAVAAFDTRFTKEGATLAMEEVSRGAKVVVAESRDRVAAMGHYWATVVQPTYTPTDADSVEWEFKIPLDKLGIDFVGRVDLVADSMTGEPNPGESKIVVDWKTARRSFGRSEAQTSLQLTAYSMAYLKKYKVLPAGVVIDELCERKKKTERTGPFISYRTILDVQALLNRIVEGRRQIASGIFPPCNPGEWWCSPRWCGYFATGKCPYVNAVRKVLVT
jgi:hypothetical protein